MIEPRDQAFYAFLGVLATGTCGVLATMLRKRMRVVGSATQKAIADGGQQNEIIKALLQEAREDRIHLRLRVDDLERGREEDAEQWDLKEAHYRDTCAGLQTQLTVAHSEVREQAREIAAQARRIAFLEQRVTDLGGQLNGH